MRRALLALALLLVPALASAGPNVLGGFAAITKTPRIIGSGTGRGFLAIEIDSAQANSIYCGPAVLSVNASTGDPWWEIEPGHVHSWGILYHGLYTAEVDIACMQTQAGTVTAQYSEEGGMPAQTASPTATGTTTSTPVDTLSPTPVNTNTPTPVNTNTRTPIPTRTKTRTATPTQSATPTST
jgi:hypothetical protein